MKLRFVLVWLVIFILMSVLTGGQALASGQNKDSKKLDIPKEPGWNHPFLSGMGVVEYYRFDRNILRSRFGSRAGLYGYPQSNSKGIGRGNNN